LADGLGVVVLAGVEIELEVCLPRVLAPYLPLAVTLEAARKGPVRDRGFEVVAAHAVDLERHVVRLGLCVRPRVVPKLCAERVTADLLEQAARGRASDVGDLHVDRDLAGARNRRRWWAVHAAALDEATLRGCGRIRR